MPEQQNELLKLWRRPGGVLSPPQVRALIAWSGTPAHERDAIRVDLESLEQVAEAKALKPKQRRGHVSRWTGLRTSFRALQPGGFGL